LPSTRKEEIAPAHSTTDRQRPRINGSKDFVNLPSA
jgi:hypothetical protein